jgi:hypothetical protein
VIAADIFEDDFWSFDRRVNYPCHRSDHKITYDLVSFQRFRILWQERRRKSHKYLCMSFSRTKMDTFLPVIS